MQAKATLKLSEVNARIDLKVAGKPFVLLVEAKKFAYP